MCFFFFNFGYFKAGLQFHLKRHYKIKSLLPSAERFSSEKGKGGVPQILRRGLFQRPQWLNAESPCLFVSNLWDRKESSCRATWGLTLTNVQIFSNDKLDSRFKFQGLYNHVHSSYSVAIAMKIVGPELLQQCNVLYKGHKTTK